ncbi:MAG: protein kinase [Gemmataceae bacterium]|nr:protein kinase [Gemmataceae bacterium]
MTATRAPWVGRDVADGKYHVLGLLGEGGMASVFRARENSTGRDVVLKVPKPALLADPEFAHRFAREVRTLVELRHPSIVNVLGFARHDGIPFAVLEYLSGGTLDDRPKPCSPDDLASWLPAISSALDHIHAAGYVHRDVKPGNILFDNNGIAKLADFGVIKAVDSATAAQTQALTGSGEALGTPQYMAPEIAKGDKCGGRADQYALAVTVYEMLAGRRPFEGSTGAVILVKQIREKPIPLDEAAGTSSAVAATVGRGMAKDASRRFPRCQDFANAVLAARSVVSDSSSPNDAREFTPRSLVVPITIGLSFLALAVGGAGMWYAFRTGGNQAGQPVAVAPIVPAADLPIAPIGPPFTFKIEGPTDAIPSGKPVKVLVRVVRRPGWVGDIRIAATADRGAVTDGDTLIPTHSDNGQVIVTPASGPFQLSVVAEADGHSQTVAIPIAVQSPLYAVQPIDDILVMPGKSASLTLFLSREGTALPVRLALELPAGISSNPSQLDFPAGRNELAITLSASPTANAGTGRLIDPGTGKELSRFNVRVTEPKTANATESRLIGKMRNAVRHVAFHPSDSGRLFAWDSSSVAEWSVTAGTSETVRSLSDSPTAVGISPDGKRLITAFGTKAMVTTIRQRTTGGQPSDLRSTILGVYFEGNQPMFRCRAGVASSAGTTVVGTSIPKNVEWVKYANVGGHSAAQLRRSADQLQWIQGAKAQTFPTPEAVVDGAISPTGRWVVGLTRSQVLLYDTTGSNPAQPIWTANSNNGTSVAVSADGRSVVVSFGPELRLFSVQP